MVVYWPYVLTASLSAELTGQKWSVNGQKADQRKNLRDFHFMHII